MGWSLGFLKRFTGSKKPRAKKSRRGAHGPFSGYHRALRCESLEERRLLTTHIPAGPITTSTTWGSDTVYVLDGTVEVRDNAQLTIPSGVVIQGSALYINDDGSGGSLVANGVNFQNTLQVYSNAQVSLSGNQFLSGDVYIAPELASSLAGNTFAAGSTVNIFGGTLAASATLPAITNVAKYSLNSTLYVRNGTSLTIAGGNTITSSYSYLYVNDDGSGGSLSASGVNFQSEVYLCAGAQLTLSGDQFVSGDVYVAPELAASLAGNTFPANSTVNILGGTLDVSTTLPAITDVAKYSLNSSLYVRNGTSLTIAGGNAITGSYSYLYVDDDGSGGSLSASGASFQTEVYLDAGAQLTLNGDSFLSGDVYVAPQLAGSLAGNTFPAGSTVNILGGTLAVSTTLPAITNVAKYDLNSTLYVRNGTSLTIASGLIITDMWLEVDDDGSGGSLSASGVNFQSRVYLDAGAQLSLSGDSFLSGDVYVVPQLAVSLVGNNFPAGATVDIVGGTLATSVTLPAITNVAKYDLNSSLYVRNGTSLTIASGLIITDMWLEVNDDGSGGSLSANGVNFQSRVYLYGGAQLSLSGDSFLSGDVYVAPQLATSLAGNTFPAGSTVDILGGTLAASVTLPAITNVAKYDFYNFVYVRNGASLTIASGLTITDSYLFVDDDGSGGSLSAGGVTFQNEVRLYAGASLPERGQLPQRRRVRRSAVGDVPGGRQLSRRLDREHSRRHACGFRDPAGHYERRQVRSLQHALRAERHDPHHRQRSDDHRLVPGGR